MGVVITSVMTALYDMLTEFEESSGEEMELDVIELCCDYTEFKDMEELQQSYPDIETIENLQDETWLVEFEGGMIVRMF
jgi:hypothetical protein